VVTAAAEESERNESPRTVDGNPNALNKQRSLPHSNNLYACRAV
jgi:hypothetical protein